MTKALVLGGGGVTGIAWELGVLCGLQRAGVPLGDADLVIGTSAGSVVGTVLTAGIDLEIAVAMQTASTSDGSGSGGGGAGRVLTALAVLADPSVPVMEARMRVGAFALSAPTRDEQSYVAGIASLLPIRDWPARELRITAMDTADGRDVVFDAASGVPLQLAVAASCAVPGLMPPVTIDGRRYMDGGIRLGAGADLAEGADQLVVIAPMAALDPARIEAEMASTGAGKTLLIAPDEAAMTAMGQNFMDPARRAPTAQAGLVQGQALAEAVRAVWPG
ncbi:patatin-like phospholipase family protein [Actinoplanes aureus]|uniref:Patatin-like phospholipase family protein n=1 Tax=Actinoplanes aureus TaxID=2792083 RepID=A0A931CFH4_9ACTN|nr:patatin-like phospholipase family protein [Actinoplanes aureus]MBG0563950.1 patatin-like phospholipase family protein [Actinoplanes aureus]